MLFTKTIAKISYRVMQRISKNSKSETIDLVVKHELIGIKPEMLKVDFN